MAFTFEKLIESILILMVFYLIYQLFFIRQASFKINRFILLAGIVSSIVFPFIQFQAPNVNQMDFYIQLKAIDVFGEGSKATKESSFYSFSHLLGYFYLLGVIFFIIRLLYQFIMMSRLFVGSEIVKKTQVRIVYTKKNYPVFSFLSYVFIGSKSEQCNGLDIIIDHERVHVVQRHSIDLLLLELLAIVQWFNPIVWLYRKLVKQNHEFLADRGVIKTGISDETYQELLLGNYKSLKLGFANSFNHSLTFKRLVMMKKIDSNMRSALKLMFVVPFIVIAVYFISCSKNEQSIKNAETDKTTATLSSKAIQTDSAYESHVLEVKPIFPGGDVGLIKFVAGNTNYPEQAIKKGIQGTVYVKFVVTETGEIGQTTIMRPVDPILEAEALRVVKSLPKWKPGILKGKPVDVWFIIPVNFKLQ